MPEEAKGEKVEMPDNPFYSLLWGARNDKK